MKVLINYEEINSLLRFGVVELTPEQFEFIKLANGKVMNVDEEITDDEYNALVVVDMLMYRGDLKMEVYEDFPEDTKAILRQFFDLRSTDVTDFGELVNLGMYDALIACGWV